MNDKEERIEKAWQKLSEAIRREQQTEAERLAAEAERLLRERRKGKAADD